MHSFPEPPWDIRQFGRKAAAIVGWALIGTALGAAGGALFGLAFTLFCALLRWDGSRIIVMYGHFIFCGAMTGAILGGFGRWVEALGGAAQANGPPRPAEDALPETVSRRLVVDLDPRREPYEEEIRNGHATRNHMTRQ